MPETNKKKIDSPINRSIRIVIEKCPFCKNNHEFSIIIKRVKVMGLSGDRDDSQSFTCLFTCPETGETFESVVPLKKSLWEKILSVRAESAGT